MDSQRISTDVAPEQKMPMGPPINPSNQLPNTGVGPRLPAGAPPPPGAPGNIGGVPGPRPIIQPGQQFPPGVRPPYPQGPGAQPPPQQRGQPPRNPAFLNRPPQPGAPIPGGPPPPPQQQVRFPQGPPGQPVQGQRPPGQPPYPPPPQQIQQQNFPNRPPFVGGEPPRQPLPSGRPPGPPLQRNDSIVGGVPGDPRLVRPSQPPDPRLQQQQQQLSNDRRAQFRPQMSVERIMTEAEINQHRPPTGPLLMSRPADDRPKSGVSETDEDNLEKQKSAVPTSGQDPRNRQPPEVQNSNMRNQAEQKPVFEINKRPDDVEMKNRVQSSLEKSKDATLETIAEIKTTQQTTNQPQMSKMDSQSDSESIKGFDNGHRKSLTTTSPPNTPVKSSGLDHDSSTKKKTSFADQQSEVKVLINDKDSNGVEKTERGVKKSASSRSIRSDAENDSGVDESTQRRDRPKSNGVADTPTKKSERKSTAGSPIKSPSKSMKSLPKTPDAVPSSAQEKKIPMNKVQVGAAPSPNLKAVRSKIGSLNNATYKPGGGNVKIENRKLDFSKAQPKIAAKNEKYAPSGGDKKIQQVKLQWNAKPKIGSLDNTTYKPGGGDKKIETVKLDFKEKAKPKVGSKENAKHVPGGGTVKSPMTPPKTPLDNTNNIETQKIDIKAESKIGSMDNVKHKPGGGDKKIFDDKSYLRQTSSNVGSISGSGSQEVARRPSSLSGVATSSTEKSVTFDTSPPPPQPPSTPTRTRQLSGLSPTMVTPRAVRTGLAKSPDSPLSPKKPGSLSPVRSGKGLRLPRLASPGAMQPNDPGLHAVQQSKITLPKLK